MDNEALVVKQLVNLAASSSSSKKTFLYAAGTSLVLLAAYNLYDSRSKAAAIGDTK